MATTKIMAETVQYYYPCPHCGCPIELSQEFWSMYAHDDEREGLINNIAKCIDCKKEWNIKIEFLEERGVNNGN